MPQDTASPLRRIFSRGWYWGVWVAVLCSFSAAPCLAGLPLKQRSLPKVLKYDPVTDRFTYSNSNSVMRMTPPPDSEEKRTDDPLSPAAAAAKPPSGGQPAAGPVEGSAVPPSIPPLPRPGGDVSYYGNRLNQFQYLGPLYRGGLYDALQDYKQQLPLEPRDYQYRRVY